MHWNTRDEPAGLYAEGGALRKGGRESMRINEEPFKRRWRETKKKRIAGRLVGMAC